MDPLHCHPFVELRSVFSATPESNQRCLDLDVGVPGPSLRGGLCGGRETLVPKSPDLVTVAFPPLPRSFEASAVSRAFLGVDREGRRGALSYPPFRLFIWGGGGGLSLAVSRTAGTVLSPPASELSAQQH